MTAKNLTNIDKKYQIKKLCFNRWFHINKSRAG